MRAPGKPWHTGRPCFRDATVLDAEWAFTLVEVLVGVGILGFTMVSLYGAFSFGFSTIKLSQEEVRADQILVQKLETLRVYEWPNLTNNYIPATFSSTFSTTGPEPGVTYEGMIKVSLFIPSGAGESYSNHLRQVTASVGWNSGGVARTRSITTLVSEYGIQTYKP